MNIPRILIAGATSSVGKTTLTAGIIAALRSRGIKVQPFKCGPDYIDTGYLTLASGLSCRNLDSWLIPPEALRELFSREASKTDIAVVEGVMGLYDGRYGTAGSGSTAEIARLLDIPIILLLDVSRTSGSAAAMALGYRSLDPGINIVGVILNNIGSPNHLRWTSEAVEKKASITVLGYLPKKDFLKLPERHLGLVPIQEMEPACLDNIRRQVEETVDLEALLRLARQSSALSESESGLFPRKKIGHKCDIAVARDEAFSFYYEDNLELLSAWGAHLEFLSPMRDTCLPKGIQGLYIGGGFPEVHASPLASNHEFRKSLLKMSMEGLPIYAECGGLMYLSQGIVDFQGQKHEMIGLIPGWAAMQKRRKRMGYALALALRNSLIAQKGEKMKGHFFHWSELSTSEEMAAYQILEPEDCLEGFIAGPRDNILASYLHLHFGSNVSLAKNFIERCSAF